MCDSHTKRANLILVAALVLFSILIAAAAPAAEGSDSPAAEPTKDKRPSFRASKFNCDRWVEAVTGGKKDDANFGGTVLASVLHQAPGFVTCAAISKEDEDLCDLAADTRQCREDFAIFREMRTNPKGRGFLIPADDYNDCKTQAEMSPFCDQMREAALAGDPNLCPAGMMEAYCRAFISLDKSACRALTEPEGISEECLKQIERKGRYAVGLDALAESGSERDRAFANAALKHPGACAALAKKAGDVCARLVPKPVEVIIPDATPASRPTARPDKKPADS